MPVAPTVPAVAVKTSRTLMTELLAIVQSEDEVNEVIRGVKEASMVMLQKWKDEPV